MKREKPKIENVSQGDEFTGLFSKLVHKVVNIRLDILEMEVFENKKWISYKTNLKFLNKMGLTPIK